MKATSLIVLIALIMLSCKKSDTVMQSSADLLGVWVTDDYSTQFTIQNTIGAGDMVRFKEVFVNGQRCLNVELPHFKQLYKIASLTDNTMHLIDQANLELDFRRVKRL